MAACRDVEARLRNMGYYTYTDASNKLTPGKKMRHWEEKGVKVRRRSCDASAAASALAMHPPLPPLLRCIRRRRRS